MRALLLTVLSFCCAAHTLVLVRWNRVGEANALATSAAFGFNGDGEPAFITRLYPTGDTNAPATNCWSWTAASFTPERRAALTQLASSPQWSEDVRVFDYDLASDSNFPFRVLTTNGLVLLSAIQGQ